MQYRRWNCPQCDTGKLCRRADCGARVAVKLDLWDNYGLTISAIVVFLIVLAAVLWL